MSTLTAAGFTVGLTPDCGPDCWKFIERWEAWWQKNTAHPMAMIDCAPGYFDRLKRESRKMVRKARRRYTYLPFNYNEHLQEIDKINLSKPIRQKRPMQGWYTQPATPTHPEHLCAVHSDTWHGAFLNGVLVAYARFCRIGDLGVPMSILGHPNATGAVNGLWAYLVENMGVNWINYLHMDSTTPSLEVFKRNIGCQEITYA